ncbi:MAG: anaerobic ribonucleoside-triphosphate reductase activating protein [Saccharofermentanales bacterium]|jgi:pyruvate formate lyase activating enzyme|nr:anaerobic ribonucleoside-triphosphate reductase activating protein [Clostridiaceae bacterium]
MILSGLVKSSTVDFPGRLSAVLFAPGCNFDCFYCHNRQLLGQHPPRIEIEDVLAFLSRRRHLLDGVVFSGGEPTLQEGLVDLIVRVRNMGFSIKLDTNGTKPGILGRLIEEQLVDYVAIDLKAPWANYPSICRCRAADVTSVQQSFRLLAASDLDWEVRTTVIPQLSLEDLEAMASSIPPAPNFFLQRYVRPHIFRPEDRFRLDSPGYTPAQLLSMAEQLRRWQPHILIR